MVQLVALLGSGTIGDASRALPTSADYMRSRAERLARHERRLDYIAIGLQLLRLVFALSSVLIISLTARYYVDHGASAEGVKIFGLGAGSVVAAFIGTSLSPLMKRLTHRVDR